MRFTSIRQTNLTQKGRQENCIYFCMHVIPTHMYYSLYERSFFWCPALTLRPKTKICIITTCVYHTAMPIISAHEDQHHICQHIYIYVYICIWSTWPKAHSKNQTQINCNWTKINCNSLESDITLLKMAKWSSWLSLDGGFNESQPVSLLFWR